MMQFRILNTSADSLTRLPADERKAAKTTAFDLGLNPAIRGLQFHRLDGYTGKNFGFVRVNARASVKAPKAEINKESENSRSFRPPKSG